MRLQSIHLRVRHRHHVLVDLLKGDRDAPAAHVREQWVLFHLVPSAHKLRPQANTIIVFSINPTMLPYRLSIEIGHVRNSRRTLAHRWHLTAAGRNADSQQNRETDHDVGAARSGFNAQLLQQRQNGNSCAFGMRMRQHNLVAWNE